jgi:hypothetical protein
LNDGVEQPRGPKASNRLVDTPSDNVTLNAVLLVRRRVRVQSIDQLEDEHRAGAQRLKLATLGSVRLVD